MLLAFLVGCSHFVLGSPMPNLDGYTIIAERDIVVEDVDGNLVTLHSVSYKRDKQFVDVLYYNKTLVAVDLAPQDPNIPALFDSGFCPIRGKFPTKASPTGRFIPVDKCPKAQVA